MHGHFHGDEGKVSAEKFLEDYRLDELDKPLLAVIEQAGQRGNGEDQSWAAKLMEEVKVRLRAAGVPVYASIDRAAEAASKLIDYYQRRKAR